jgi:hypothetical protein
VNTAGLPSILIDQSGMIFSFSLSPTVPNHPRNVEHFAILVASKAAGFPALVAAMNFVA